MINFIIMWIFGVDIDVLKYIFDIMLNYLFSDQNVAAAINNDVVENVLNNQIKEVENLIKKAAIAMWKIEIEYGEEGSSDTSDTSDNSSSDIDADLKNNMSDFYLKWLV